MTHWWTIFPLAIALVAFWFISLVSIVLETDRGWAKWKAMGLAILLSVGDLALIHWLTPNWGTGRMIAATFICYTLLCIGEVTHLLRHRKPLLRLPRK